MGNGITMSVPADWRPMDNLDFTERYPSVRAPLAAYTDSEREADISVNISATQWPDADVVLAKSFFKASLLNMFDKVEIINEGVKTIRKKKYIYFEFTSRVNGNRRNESLREPVLKYCYIQYLIEPGRTLVFTFNCPKRMQQTWQPVAQKMMDTMRVR